MAIFRAYRSTEGVGAVAGSPARALAAPTIRAASTTRATPALGFALAGLALAIAGAIAGWILFEAVDPEPFRPASDYSAFAALFILAAAVERLLEPFTPYVKPDTEDTKKELEAAVVRAENDDAPETAANKQAQLDRERSERAFLLWGIATLVATLACAGLGVLLIRSVAAAAQAPLDDPNRFLDLVVTGFVVGAGTKPLHDLIARLEKQKEKVTDPSETSS